MAELAAGPSSGTAQNAAVQRAAATDDAGASLESQHGPVRGARREPMAGDDEIQQQEAQLQEEEQQREVKLVVASGAGCGAGEATAAATANEAAAGGCDGPVLKQARCGIATGGGDRRRGRVAGTETRPRARRGV
jgi:hypothetical protein